MAGKIYALLVGINDYPASVRPLYGCENDVLGAEETLRMFYSDGLEIRKLINAEATRAAVIEGFRSFLSQAGEGDVALFHYSGHGAQMPSNAAFGSYERSGKDETLVCYDSRQPGSYDIADKEMAYLIALLGRKNPEIVIRLDCCHSGSGTRALPEDGLAAARSFPADSRERPLESYLGYGEGADTTVAMPLQRHILLAACAPNEPALELKSKKGLFSATMDKVLRRTGCEISYADLYMECQRRMSRRTDQQHPQFEPFLNFNTWRGFLGKSVAQAAATQQLYYDEGRLLWYIDHDLLTYRQLNGVIGKHFCIYPDRAAALVQSGPFCRVELVKSSPTRSWFWLVQEDAAPFELDIDQEEGYALTMDLLPASPLIVGYDLPDDWVAALMAVADLVPEVDFQAQHPLAQWQLRAQAGAMALLHRLSGHCIATVPCKVPADVEGMIPILYSLLRWLESIGLQQPDSEFARSEVRFFMEVKTEGGWLPFDGPELWLLTDQNARGPVARTVRMLAQNATGEKVFVALFHHGDDLSINLFLEKEMQTATQAEILWGSGEEGRIGLGTDVMASTEVLQLLAANEALPRVTLAQPGVGSGVRTRETFVVRHRNIPRYDWLLRKLRIHLLRDLGRLSGTLEVMGGSLRLQATQGFAATLSLMDLYEHIPGKEDLRGPAEALQSLGHTVLGLNPAQAQQPSILVLSQITGSLDEALVTITLAQPLGAEEWIVAFAEKGGQVIAVGSSDKDEAGHARVQIGNLSDIGAVLPGELGTTVRLCFAKVRAAAGSAIVVGDFDGNPWLTWQHGL